MIDERIAELRAEQVEEYGEDHLLVGLTDAMISLAELREDHPGWTDDIRHVMNSVKNLGEYVITQHTGIK